MDAGGGGATERERERRERERESGGGGGRGATERERERERERITNNQEVFLSCTTWLGGCSRCPETILILQQLIGGRGALPNIKGGAEVKRVKH